MIKQRLLLGLLVGISALTALLGFFADSEIWSLTHAQALWLNPIESEYLRRPLFNLLLWCTSVFSDLVEHQLLIARALFYLNSILTLYFVYKIAKQLTNSINVATIIVLWLLISWSWVTQSYRLRADLLAVTPILIGLFYWLKDVGCRRSYIFWLGALLITPKSIFMLFSLWPIVLDFTKIKKNKLNIYASLFGGILILAIFIQYGVLTQTLNYYVGSLEQIKIFYYPKQFLLKNPHWVILFLSLVVLCFKSQHIKQIRSSVLVILTSLLFICLHTEKLPFYLASWMPLLGIFMIYSLWILKPKIFEAKYTHLVLNVFAVISICMHIYVWRSHNNLSQIANIKFFKSYLNSYSDRISYDTLGLFTQNIPRGYSTYMAEAEPTLNKKRLEEIKLIKPDFIFFENKMYLLGPEFSKFLSENYLRTAKGLYLKTLMIKPEGDKLDMQNISSEMIKKYRLRLDRPLIFTIIFFKDDGHGSGPDDYGVKTPFHALRLELPLADQYVAVPKETAFIKITPFKAPDDTDHKSLGGLFRFDGEI